MSAKKCKSLSGKFSVYLHLETVKIFKSSIDYLYFCGMINMYKYVWEYVQRYEYLKSLKFLSIYKE